MAIFKVAKVLDNSDAVSSLANNTLLLTKETGDNKGIRLSYKDNDSEMRILSPLEEFERYYKYSDDSSDENALVNNKKDNAGTVEVESKATSIVIMDVIDYSNSLDNAVPTVKLPAIDTTSISKGIYYTQKVRIVVDRNIKGFSITTGSSSDKIRILEGDVTSITVTKAFTSFDVYSAPDGKWRILGEYLDNTADVLAMVGNNNTIDEDGTLPGTVGDSTSWAEVMALTS